MRTTKPLTDADCRALKPDSERNKRPRKYDGGGLFLEALPTGRKVWRLKYTGPDGRESKATFGEYPAVPLSVARARREEARGMLAAGLDINAELSRRADADNALADAGNFGAVARRWFADEIEPLSETYRTAILAKLDKDVLPYLGKRPMESITVPEVRDVLLRIKARGAEETARRVRVLIGQIFRYAARQGITERDPTQALKGERRTKPVKHFAALTEAPDVARLVRDIHSYRGTPTVRALLRLSALLFQRPGELRTMQWPEINWEAAQWRYVVSKNKRHTARTHIVPLSEQALEVLRDLQPLTDHPIAHRPDMPHYVFPGARGRSRPLSENAARQALRNMGYSNDDMTPHGFRAMARSLLSEHGWTIDAIERQLSHKAAGPLGGAYDRAQFLDERRRMMQAWADLLDRLRDGVATVTSIRRARA
ncbi:MAG: integrase arm-type DNA-binding domain-containing protein [Oceanococcaceae bacterium]